MGRVPTIRRAAVTFAVAAVALGSTLAAASDHTDDQTVTITVVETVRSVTVGRADDRPAVSFQITAGASVTESDTFTRLSFTNNAAEEAKILVTRDDTDLRGLTLRVRFAGTVTTTFDFDAAPFDRPEHDPGDSGQTPGVNLNFGGVDEEPSYAFTPINLPDGFGPEPALLFSIEPNTEVTDDNAVIIALTAGAAPTTHEGGDPISADNPLEIQTTLTYTIVDDVRDEESNGD